MTEITTIHFVRHGLVHNPKEIYYGRLPGFRLGEEGLAQAEAAGKVLSQYPITAVFSSPMERAVQTSEEILKHVDGINLEITDLLAEVYSPFDGQALSAMSDRNWDVYTGSNPPYEQPIDVLNRAKNFVEKIRREFNGSQVVATSHGDLIAFMLLFAMDKQISLEEKQLLYQAYIGHASITSFAYQGDSNNQLPKFNYLDPNK